MLWAADAKVVVDKTLVFEDMAVEMNCRMDESVVALVAVEWDCSGSAVEVDVVERWIAVGGLAHLQENILMGNNLAAGCAGGVVERRADMTVCGSRWGWSMTKFRAPVDVRTSTEVDGDRDRCSVEVAFLMEFDHAGLRRDRVFAVAAEDELVEPVLLDETAAVHFAQDIEAEGFGSLKD